MARRPRSPASRARDNARKRLNRSMAALDRQRIAEDVRRQAVGLPPLPPPPPLYKPPSNALLAVVGIAVILGIIGYAVASGLNKAACYERANHGDVAWSVCEPYHQK